MTILYANKIQIPLILDREQSLGRKEGLPTTHQETKYAKFPLVEIDVPVNQI
jgi:hypothetical protein